MIPTSEMLYIMIALVFIHNSIKLASWQEIGYLSENKFAVIHF
jgi:hypothetical protein